MTAADDDATPPEEETPEPVAAEPVAAEPVAAEPVAAEPVAAEPVAAEAAAEPAAAEPVAAEPVAAEPVAAEPVAAAKAEAADVAEDSTSAKPAKKSAPDAEDPPTPPPPPDPATCKGIVIGQLAFEDSVLAGEFDDSEFLFYLEPAGVLNANLRCMHAYPAETVRGGILMTKAARDAKKVFLDDGVNPDEYELEFPKEFGYVKSLQHYVPESREHAKFPWSKKY